MTLQLFFKKTKSPALAKSSKKLFGESDEIFC